MTQVAATVASIAGKNAHAAKGGHGAKGGAGADFASVVAGLSLDGDDAGDADGLTLTGDEAATGKGAGKGQGDGKTGEPVVLDLSLNAAAQSAVADTVVAATQVPVKTATPKDAPARTDDALSLDTKGGDRSTWRMMQEKVATGTGAPSTPVKGGKPSRQESAATTASSAPVQTDTDTDTDTALPAEVQAMMQQVATTTPQQAGDAATMASRRSTRQGAKTAAIQTGASPRQAAAEPAKATTEKPTAVPLAPIFSALPQAVRDPKGQAVANPATPATAQPVDGKAVDPVQLAAAQAVVTDVVPTTTPQATGRPVMSALHRADPANAQALPVDGKAGNGGETAQDQGKGSDSGSGTRSGSAATTLGNDNQASSSADATAPAGPRFSDILQSLPPIAQSRMGTVADVSPIVTGPGDVGATLQGQAIDMGVNGQWIDRMAKEITALSEGTGHSRFQLNPPNLGRIQIDIQHGENGGQVRLTTETDEAAKRLQDGKPALEADARLSALSINSITIERSSAGFDSGRDPNPQQNAQQNQQQSHQRHQQAGDQGFGQAGTQTGAQSDGRGSQAGAQANAQANSQGQQNSNGQGKGPWSRDVLNERAGTVAQDGNSVRRDGDRLIRYA